MQHETIYLGPTPAEENPTQVGHPDYEERARKECLAYAEAIRKVCGPEPDGARLRVKRESHDYGSYLELVCNYDPENPVAVSYAMKCDEHAPTTWEAAGVESPHAVPADGRRYVGTRTPEGDAVVVVDASGSERPLDPRLDLRNHSPTGFSWSYAGSGPAQLALAILSDAVGDESGQEHYQRYKRDVIAHIQAESFDIPQEQVRRTVARYEAERGRGA